MLIQDSDLLGNNIALQSRMVARNHVLVGCGHAGSEAHYHRSLNQMFIADRTFLLGYIRRLESEQVMMYTGGLLPEDLDFTPEATEVKLYRSGVTQGLPCLERKVAEQGITLEEAAQKVERHHQVLQEMLRRLKFDAEATVQTVESLNADEHRKLDAIYLRLKRFEDRTQVQS